MTLYVLKFNDENLIKIGITVDVVSRLAQLGSYRFDLAESHFVTSENGRVIKLMERSLHEIFRQHRAESKSPIETGNTEIFDSSVIESVLDSISKITEVFSHADISAPKGVILPNRTSGPKVRVYANGGRKTNFKIRQISVNGKPFWQVTSPRFDGSPGRILRTFKDRECAETCLADFKREFEKNPPRGFYIKVNY